MWYRMRFCKCADTSIGIYAQYNNEMVFSIIACNCMCCNVQAGIWDKQSYSYHGDNGYSFCSSGTGQPYDFHWKQWPTPIKVCVNRLSLGCYGLLYRKYM